MILGVGGRVAMRGIAVVGGQPGGFSFGGSSTVVFLGAVAGAAGGLVFAGLRLLLPRHQILQAALFWIFLVLVTLRGLRPLDGARLAWFLPPVGLYGIALELLWRRIARAS
jgi:hypothetical protein